VRHVLTGVVLAAAVAGCGASGGSGSAQVTSRSVSEAPQAPTGPHAPTTLPSCVSAPPRAEHVAGTTDLSKKPQIEVPDSPPPCNLVVGDIVAGNGPAAKPGDKLTMKYVGVLYSNGKQFDASWDHGQDFPFTLGGGQVIQGWDQGMVGMKVGGRRQLVIPPSMAYGDQDQGPNLPANSTLIFVVDLVRIG
jgi:peptidylprolyl isomerase